MPLSFSVAKGHVSAALGTEPPELTRSGAPPEAGHAACADASGLKHSTEKQPSKVACPEVFGLLVGVRTCKSLRLHHEARWLLGHFFKVTLPAPRTTKESGCRLKRSKGRLQITDVTEMPVLATGLRPPKKETTAAQISDGAFG